MLESSEKGRMREKTPGLPMSVVEAKAKKRISEYQRIRREIRPKMIRSYLNGDTKGFKEAEKSHDQSFDSEILVRKLVFRKKWREIAHAFKETKRTFGVMVQALISNKQS